MTFVRKVIPILVLVVAAATLMLATPGTAKVPRLPHAILAKVKLATADGRSRSLETRNLIPGGVRVFSSDSPSVGTLLTHSSRLNGACYPPTYGGPSDSGEAHEKTVFGLAFPPRVVRVHLDLGELGERDVPLRLLTKHQARKAHVKRFRWGYLKLVGKRCLHGITGYDSQEHVVYQAIDGPATPCEPDPTHVAR